MKCPHCDSPVDGCADSCHSCGFDAAMSSARHGHHWVRLDRLTDASRCLSLREHRRLEAHLDDFERRFPQVFLAVYFGVLPQGLRAPEVGFWLLNHAAFGTCEIAKRNEFGIVIVVDPAAGAASVSFGYAVEALVGDIEAGGILTRMCKTLACSRYGEAVETAICHLDKRLRLIGKADRRAPGASCIDTVSDDLGLSPLTPHGTSRHADARMKSGRGFSQ